MSKSSAQRMHMGGDTQRVTYCDVIKMKRFIKFLMN